MATIYSILAIYGSPTLVYSASTVCRSMYEVFKVLINNSDTTSSLLSMCYIGKAAP